MLHVSANLAVTREIDRVRVEVRRAGEAVLLQGETKLLGPGNVMFPAGFEVIPLGHQALHLSIDVVGLLGNIEIARDRSTTMVAPGWQKDLDARLENATVAPQQKPQADQPEPESTGAIVQPAIARLDAKLDARCPLSSLAQCAEDETCRAGVCVPAEQDFAGLPLLRTSDIPAATKTSIDEQCLDVVEYFAPANTLVLRDGCTFESPIGVGEPNMALVLPAGGKGFCNQVRCLAPLDMGAAPSGDWLEMADGSIVLQGGLCTQFQSGLSEPIVGLRGDQPSKTAASWLCPVPPDEPGGASGGAGGGAADGGGAGGGGAGGGAVGGGGAGGGGAGGQGDAGETSMGGGAGCSDACKVSAKHCSTSEDAVESCEVGSNGCTALNVVPCDKGTVCERLGTPICHDPAWAAWPMPNSQKDSDAGAPNLLSYQDNGDGTVTDNVTGLVWQQVAGGLFDDAGARSYCDTLDFAGYQNWRLPTVIELISLLDFDHSPLLSPKYFLDKTVDLFRSSQGGWTVDFGDGHTGFSNDGLKFQVRCVR